MNTPELITKYSGDVRKLLKEAGLPRIPVDVERVAEHLGLKIIERPLEDEYSGYLTVKEKNIVVNSAHSPARQRFTIAHEIGHFQLHCQQADTPMFVDQTVYFRAPQFSDEARAREREANYFAAELLMPEEWLAKYLDAHPMNASAYSREVRELADEFKVSKQTMEFRLRDLGFVLPTSI